MFRGFIERIAGTYLGWHRTQTAGIYTIQNTVGFTLQSILLSILCVSSQIILTATPQWKRDAEKSSKVHVLCNYTMWHTFCGPTDRIWSQIPNSLWVTVGEIHNFSSLSSLFHDRTNNIQSPHYCRTFCLHESWNSSLHIFSGSVTWQPHIGSGWPRISNPELSNLNSHPASFWF